MANDIIFSRAGNDGELSNERIMQLAPSVFATDHRDTLTQRYAQLNTASLMPVMRDYGYVPVQAQQRRLRAGSAVRLEHKHHLLAFAHVDDLEGNDGLRGEILLYNSHDGSSAIKLMAGAYRFVCSNGIIAGEGSTNTVRHSANGVAGFEQMLRNVIESMPKMMERIELLRSTQVTVDQTIEMAKRSAAVRWNMLNPDDPVLKTGTLRGIYADDRTTGMLSTHIRRNEDDLNDAWTVFNRIQEGVVRGKCDVRSFTERSPHGALRKARPISSVTEGVRVNRELWDIAEDVAFAA